MNRKESQKNAAWLPTAHTAEQAMISVMKKEIHEFKSAPIRATRLL